jgi:hypothetical protein
MMAWLARPLAVVAALGWIVTTVASLAALAGVQLPTWLQGAMFIAMFPLALAAMVIWRKVTVRDQDKWKAAFRGYPFWLRYVIIWGVLGYAALCFILTIIGQHEAAVIGFIGVFYAAILRTCIAVATIASSTSSAANAALKSNTTRSSS